MKCYVCYFDYDQEGSSKPETAFWYKKDAEKWKEEEVPYGEYEEIEIE